MKSFLPFLLAVLAAPLGCFEAPDQTPRPCVDCEPEPEPEPDPEPEPEPPFEQPVGGVQFDNPNVPAALGGTLTLRTLDGAGDLYADRYVARATGALEIVELSPPAIVVRGRSLGSGTIELIDPDTREVFGFLSKEVREIASAEMRYALKSKKKKRLNLELSAADGTRMVDESTVLEALSATGATSSSLVLGPLEAQFVTVTATIGSGTVFEMEVEVADTADAIINVFELEEAPFALELAAGESVRIYPWALRGGYSFLGASFLVQAPAELTVRRSEDFLRPFVVSGEIPGTYELVVLEGGGFSIVVPVTVL